MTTPSQRSVRPGPATFNGCTELTCEYHGRINEALRSAWQNGHDLAWDPPFGGTLRWTCSVCGEATLRSITGVIYGDAQTTPCSQAVTP